MAFRTETFVNRSGLRVEVKLADTRNGNWSLTAETYEGKYRNKRVHSTVFVDHGNDPAVGRRRFDLMVKQMRRSPHFYDLQGRNK